MADYADIADDPVASKKLGTAIKMTLNPTEFGKTGSGFLDLLKQSMGVPQLDAQLAAQNMSEAVKGLTDKNGKPDARLNAAYQASINGITHAAGLRGIIGGSTSNAQVQKVENDVPLIGVNLGDGGSTAFKDKLGLLVGNDIQTAAARNPSINKAERDFMNRRISELRGGKLTQPPGIKNGTSVTKIRVKGPNGQTGMADSDATLPAGWSKVNP
jgi:hypothetical protein